MVSKESERDQKRIKKIKEDIKILQKSLRNRPENKKIIATKKALINTISNRYNTSKKIVINNKGLTPARKLAKGESKVRKSDIMGGKYGPSGPLGSKLDAKKKKKVVKKKVVAKKYNPRKANRAGQKYGQR